MSYLDYSSISCGIGELSGLFGGPKKIIKEQKRFLTDFGIIIFSDRVSNKEGQRLANYITKHKLGTVEKSSIAINPVHNSKIELFCWKPDKEALENFEP